MAEKLADVADVLAALMSAPETEVRYRRDLCREAHSRGYADGWEEGRRALLEELAAEQRYACGVVRRSFETPAFAVLEERRWGPGGRGRFGDPRPGDYQGGPVAAW